MNREQIIQEVLVRMDEVSPLSGINVIPNPVVEKSLDESARTIILSAPNHLVPFQDFSSGSKVGIPSPEVDVSRIALPVKFLRLVRFKLNTWMKPTYKVLEEGSKSHLKQYHKYTFGGTTRPVVTVIQSDGTPWLEFYYKKGTTPTIETALCAVETKAEDMPDILLIPLFWQSAALAFQILGMGDNMNVCLAKVKEQLDLLRGV